MNQTVEEKCITNIAKSYKKVTRIFDMTWLCNNILPINALAVCFFISHKYLSNNTLIIEP